MRIMAIDYGDARTGVAVSDLMGMIAGYTTVIPGRRNETIINEIIRLAQSHQVEELVVGLPRNMDGTEGPRAQLCRSFAEELEKATGLPVTMWDERRTTVEAHAILHQSGKRMKDHRKNVDAVAAALILESYLMRKRQTQGK